MTSSRALDKVFVETPDPSPPPNLPARVLWRFAGTALAPIYAALAADRGAPGIPFHQAASGHALRWLIGNRAPEARRWLFNLVGSPVILTRYQEFDFAWRHVPAHVERYLDVSSPSIFPLRLVAERPNVRATLLNPDAKDLQLTEQLIRAGGIEDRCTTSSALVGDLDVPDAWFDLITSLSVVEHIPNNKDAITNMWRVLRPGGVLLITVPCAAHAHEVHTSSDHYGLLNKDEQGHVFLEYVYDEPLLQEFIFDVTGQPSAMEVYGEARAGFLRDELQRRWSGSRTRFWEEPVLMGREFKRFKRIADLPGEGVVGLAFVKV